MLNGEKSERTNERTKSDARAMLVRSPIEQINICSVLLLVDENIDF